MAQDTLQALSAAHLDAVYVQAGVSDTRLERALQEALITALFEKKVTLLDAPAQGMPSIRVVAFATPASEVERENMLQKGVAIVKRVLGHRKHASLPPGGLGSRSLRPLRNGDTG